MRWVSSGRGALAHLGSLQGDGVLRAAAGKHSDVAYEIDGYRERARVSANGRIVGEAGALGRAFRAGSAELVLADNSSIQIALYDPRGNAAAEFVISGTMPAFPRG